MPRYSSNVPSQCISWKYLSWLIESTMRISFPLFGIITTSIIFLPRGSFSPSPTEAKIPFGNSGRYRSRGRRHGSMRADKSHSLSYRIGTGWRLWASTVGTDKIKSHEVPPHGFFRTPHPLWSFFGPFISFYASNLTLHTKSVNNDFCEEIEHSDVIRVLFCLRLRDS